MSRTPIIALFSGMFVFSVHAISEELDEVALMHVLQPKVQRIMMQSESVAKKYVAILSPKEHLVARYFYGGPMEGRYYCTWHLQKNGIKREFGFSSAKSRVYFVVLENVLEKLRKSNNDSTGQVVD